ncbi:putative membrane protein [Microbacterium hydrothermale]|uniref:PH domain-containing protein n=1 Tax=Microbacterium hydrothermale TaxID=857427 RepID=UPI0022279633|nr:PH domain-containing protein [Microbacterium hydrothermale]MCW2163353.1 putative membrane protein [Microbacterium hydrothermale]
MSDPGREPGAAGHDPEERSGAAGGGAGERLGAVGDGAAAAPGAVGGDPGEARAAGGDPGARRGPVVRSPYSDGEWHRLHPLTPLLRGGLSLLVIGGLIVANLRERLLELFFPVFTDLPPGELPPDPVDFLLANNLILIAAGVALAVLLVLLALFRLSWRFHTLRIGADDVEVRSGVLFRTHRRAPLDRVQGVNLTRPMLARLLGLAKLEVVGAGLDANVKLEYLSGKDAEAIRGDILRLASGRRLAEAGADPRDRRPLVTVAADTVADGLQGIVDGEDFSDAEPESIVRIPLGRLVASRVLSGSTLVLIAFVVGIVVAASVSTLWLLFTVVPMFLAFGAYYVRSVARGLRYSIAPTSDGVRVTFGLFTTVTEVVPPGRVHAIEVRQPLLWRPFGWWSVTVNRLSGRASTDSGTDQLAAVLPIGTRADVERVLRILAPGLPGDEWTLVFRNGILGPVEDDPYLTTPRRARWLRPLSWRRNGVLLTADALLLRRGWIWRSLTLLPLARLQSVGVHQGPLARAVRTATLTGHVIAGTVQTTLGAIDRDDALRLFDATARGAVAAAAGDRTHRWAG